MNREVYFMDRFELEMLKKKYEEWLNEMGPPRKVAELIGRPPSYEERIGFKYGTWVRENDPATFEAGFIEWFRSYRDARIKFVNLTPHRICLMPEGPDGPMIVIPPSGTVARCATSRVKVDTFTVKGVSIPVNRTQFGEVTGLPDPQPDTIYIVSAVVAQAVPERDDVFITDDAVRDDQGRIIGARALAHV